MLRNHKVAHGILPSLCFICLFHGATFALLKKGTLQKLLLSISEYLYMHKCCIDMQRTSETTWFRRHVHFYAVPPRRLVAIFYFVGRDLDAS